MIGTPRTPPRFVPTLTAVVDLTPVPDVPVDTTIHLEERLVSRVLQRVNLSLERRLNDAVSEVVKQQLDALMPRLHEKIEGVVRALVIEALAHEVSENTGSMPSQTPRSLG